MRVREIKNRQLQSVVIIYVAEMYYSKIWWANTNWIATLSISILLYVFDEGVYIKVEFGIYTKKISNDLYIPKLSMIHLLLMSLNLSDAYSGNFITLILLLFYLLYSVLVYYK